MPTARSLLALAALAPALQACTPALPSPAPAVGPELSLVNPGHLTFGVDLSYPPQDFLDGHARPTGFDVDLGRALSQRLGLEGDFVGQDFGDLLYALQAQRFDAGLSAIGISPERSRRVRFLPYLRAGLVVLVRRGAPHPPASLADLCGLQVAVRAAGAAADQVHAISCGTAPRLTELGTDDAVLSEVVDGNVDAEVTDASVAAYDQSRDGRVVAAGSRVDRGFEGIATRASDQDLCSRLRDALRLLVADGTYGRLIRHWGLTDQGVDSPGGAPPSACASPSDGSPPPAPASPA